MASLPHLSTAFRDPRRASFAKSQTLNKRNGYQTVQLQPPTAGEVSNATRQLMAATRRLDASRALAGTTGAAAAASPASASHTGAVTGQFQPAFAALDKQVCVFDAYFKEAVPESAVESYRVHLVKLQYFLEDGTVCLIEKREENSGLMQGRLVKRHRVPHATEPRAIEVYDLNVGGTIEMYGRVYRIFDCNSFTREYLSSIGVEVPPAEPAPADPYRQRMAASSRENKALRAPADAGSRAARGALGAAAPWKNTGAPLDGKVLRFYSVWDDRESPLGEARALIVHYYLVDDTMEILETKRPNDGRDPFPIFLKRQKLSKQRVATSVSAPSAPVADPYTPGDLVVGDTINVLGRTILLYDADEFTKRFYTEYFGVREFNVVRIEEAKPQAPRAPTPPPMLGIGSEEDTRASLKSLVPKPPQRDFRKYIENDGKVLRFAARLVSTRPVDAQRAFVVSYFLADDTVQVFECAQRNSGISGGKFLERGKYKNGGDSRYFQPSDLAIGREVEVLKHRFVLVDADEYALKHMESNSDVFPECNVMAIEAAIQSAISERGGDPAAYFRSIDTEGNGLVSAEEFATAVHDLHKDVTQQELITLMRRYGATDATGQIALQDFVRSVSQVGSTRSVQQQQLGALLERMRAVLKRRGADSMATIGRSFRIMDDNRSGTLDKAEFRKAMMSYGISISAQDVDLLFAAFDRDNSGTIDYEEFLREFRGPMSERRRQLVLECFGKLDKTGNGVVDFDDVRDVFSAREHPEVKAGRKTAAQVLHEFLGNFDVIKKDGTITTDEFIEYYEAISAGIDNDDYFELMIRSAWNLDRRTK
jgi:Ca2+-binding EF-hand superfamily protein